MHTTTPKTVKQVTFNDRISAISPLQMSPSYSTTSNNTSNSGSGGGILNATYSPLQHFRSSREMMAENVEAPTEQNYPFSIRMLGAIINDGHGRLKIAWNTMKQFKEQLSDVAKYHREHAECVIKLSNNNDATSRDMNSLTSKVLTCNFDKKRHSEITATYKTMLQAITTESEKDENEYFATHEKINLLKGKLNELEKQKEQREQVKFKKAEAERQRKEQEEAKRKVKEEEERKRKEAEAEEEARCKAEEEEGRKRQAEKEAQRKAEEAEHKRMHKEVERQRKELERQRKESERKRKASEEKAERQRKEDERWREIVEKNAERQRKIKETAEAELERLKQEKMTTAATNKRERVPIYRSKETPPQHPSPLMDSSAKKKRNSMEDISKTPFKKSNIPKVNEDTGTSKDVATPQVTPAKVQKPKVILNTPKNGSHQTPKKTIPQTPKLPNINKTMDTDYDEEDSFWNDD